MSRLGRALARLLPPGRRDWAEALWAEAGEVPAGRERLAWRAGGVRLMAREARLGHRTLVLLLVAAAAWAAWPTSAVPLAHGAADQGDVIITIALLAGLPLPVRWLLGPPVDRPARWLRAGCYAAILVIMPAKAVAERFAGAVPRGGIDLRSFYHFTQGYPAPGSASGGPDWRGEIILLLLTACYLAAVLALTARGAKMASATLATGAVAGLVVGAVIYVVNPLGGAGNSTSPWLHGAPGDPLAVLAWVVLLGAPAVAGALAARRCPAPGDPARSASAQARQGFTAGLVTGGVGALTAAVLGTGTVALMIKSAPVRGWLFHGAHLTASAVYGRELYASGAVIFYAVICVAFPVFGAIMGLAGTGLAGALPAAQAGQDGPPGHGGRDAGAPGGLAGAA